MIEHNGADIAPLLSLSLSHQRDTRSEPRRVGNKNNAEQAPTNAIRLPAPQANLAWGLEVNVAGRGLPFGCITNNIIDYLLILLAQGLCFDFAHTRV